MPTCLEFEESVNRKLRLFMTASKMSLKDITNDAVDEYITRYLKDNAGVRAKYEAEETRLLAAAGGNISLIKPRKPKNSEAAKEAQK